MPTPRPLLLLTLFALLALPSSASAVIGGQAASQPYPHMAAMTANDGEWAGCGGSLVRADWVLTAAHCVEGADEQDVGWLFGTHDLLSPGAGEEIPAAEVIVHERWGDDDNTDASSFDVALVRLARPATKGTPIRIASPQTEKGLWAPGETATVIGWGSREPVGVLYSESSLQELDVPMIDDDECSTFYPGLPIIGAFDPETMVCAGYTEGTKDSCYGDSGGPLMVPDASGALVQVGVVSWGNQCALPTQYGVYSRVADAPLYDWIASKLPAAQTTTTTTTTTSTAAPKSSTSAPAAQPTPTPAAATPALATPAAKAVRAKKRTARQRCVAKARKLRGSKRRRALKRCAKVVKAKTRRA